MKIQPPRTRYLGKVAGLTNGGSSGVAVRDTCWIEEPLRRPR